MSKKRWVFIVLAVVVVSSVIVGITMYNKPHEDILAAEPDYIVTVNEIVKDFQSQPDSAQTKYGNAILLVNGPLQEISKTGNSFTFFIGDDPMSGVQALMDSSFMAGFEQDKIAEGQNVKIKGRFTGFDDLFGTVQINRALVIEE